MDVLLPAADLLLLGAEALLTGAGVLLLGADVLLLGADVPLTDADVLVPKVGLLVLEAAGSGFFDVLADSFDDDVLTAGSGEKSLAKEDPKEKSA